MIRLELSLDLDYEIIDPFADFVFHIHAAHTRHQRVVEEELLLSQPVARQVDTDPVSGNRCLRLQAHAGPLRVSYRAVIDLQHHVADPSSITEVPIARIPTPLMRWIYPSRYCQSDRLLSLAAREFGSLEHGYARVDRIAFWVREHVAFQANSSDSNTSAVDTLIDAAGVCRDFAHLMIALCRAINIPARFATGIDYGADPALGPTDFHAYVEAWLGDRWYIFDPSGAAIPMGFVRFGTGRDAADVAFATIFGAVKSSAPVIRIAAVANSDGQLLVPQHTEKALSTDA